MHPIHAPRSARRASGTRIAAILTFALATNCGANRSSSAAPALIPAASATTLAWTDTAIGYRNAVGRTVNVRCPPGRATAPIWGTDVYTDNSSICTAALHAGRISMAEGGVVGIEIRPRADGYAGTLRNGVASLDQGASEASFALVGGPAPGLFAATLQPTTPPPPPIDPWTVNATSHRGHPGEAYTQVCPPGTTRTAWGTDVYTDDSSICTAAVHAGRITAEAGGHVTYFILPGRGLYFGTERHGVTSTDYQAYPGSFAFDRVPQGPGFEAPPGARLVNWSSTAVDLRGEHDATAMFCPPGVALHTVWGSGVYTDDSSVCSAAVHAGRIELNAGGAVTIRPSAGRASYHGSTAHGVTTQDYGTFAGSFTVEH
jgi:hypothetical protein